MVPSDIIKDLTNNPGAASSPQAADGGHPDMILLLGRMVPENSQKRCALCQNSIPDSVKPCTFPSTAPAALAALNPHLGSEAYSSGPKVFCHKCWVWIYNLSICWTCGETVARGEEKVSYGWCWWHWACVSCMICRNPIPPPPWTNDPRGIALRKLPLCRYCVEDLSFLKIEIVQDTLPAIMPLPEPALPSQPESSESCRRRPTPKWMDKLPSNRVSKQSAPLIPEPLTPQILEPSGPPCILKQPQPPPPRTSRKNSTPKPSSPSSSSPCTTILVPPDSKTSPSSSATTTNATVVIAELRTPIRSSSIHKTFATAAALARTSARRRRRYDSRSSP